MNNTSLEKKYPLDDKQITYFQERQSKHERRVKEAAIILAANFPEIAKDLHKEVENHDASKWGKDEYFAYVWLTSHLGELKYKYPSKELEDYINSKWEHHYSVNSHHPEYWALHSSIEDMPDSELAHMVADWAAMSIEKNNSLIGWWKNKASKKFKFSRRQSELIEKYISVFPDLNYED